MPAPLTGRRPAYPLLLLLAAVLTASCATTRPGVETGPASRPATTDPTPATPSASSAPTATAALPSASAPAPQPPPAEVRHVFPARASNASHHPTHSGYPATDIFADCGAPVVAVMDGSVLEVSRVDRFDPGGPRGPFNGGLSVAVLGDDGVRYYGSHLTEVAAGLNPGVRVVAGQQTRHRRPDRQREQRVSPALRHLTAVSGEGRLVDPAGGGVAGALPGRVATWGQPLARRGGGGLATPTRLPEGAVSVLAAAARLQE